MKILIDNDKPLCSLAPDCRWSVWNDLIEVEDRHLVLFNTLSQTAVLMRKDEYVAIESLSQDQAATLFRLGMLIPQDTDEREIVEKRFAEGKKDLSYLDLTILLTQQCQFRCTYCFEGTKKDASLDEHTENDIMEFLESQRPTLKKLRVTWFGGEPLIAYSRLKTLSQKLLDFCEKHQVSYAADMVTNGFAINEERCRELIDDLKVKRYIITLDGPASQHDRRRPLRNGLPTFGKIWKNIDTLVQCGAQVNIRMTIDKENHEAIPTLLDAIATGPFARKTGLSFCRTMDYDFTPENIKNVIFSEKEFADIEWSLIQHAHQLGLWSYRFPHCAPLGGCLREGDIVIGTHGEIYKCLDTVGDEQWVSGHIGKDTGENRPDWYERWLRWSPSQSASCRQCVLQPLCNGGCPHNALFRDKKHGTNLQCPDWKANYRRQIIELAKEIIHKNPIL